MNEFVIEFLRKVAREETLQKQVKNITDPNEIVNIAQRNGCIFSLQELVQSIKLIKEESDNIRDFLAKTKSIEGEGFISSSPIRTLPPGVEAFDYLDDDFFKSLESYQLSSRNVD